MIYRKDDGMVFESLESMNSFLEKHEKIKLECEGDESMFKNKVKELIESYPEFKDKED